MANAMAPSCLRLKVCQAELGLGKGHLGEMQNASFGALSVP